MNNCESRLFGPEPAYDIIPGRNLIGGSSLGSSRIPLVANFFTFSSFEYVIPNYNNSF